MTVLRVGPRSVGAAITDVVAAEVPGVTRRCLSSKTGMAIYSRRVVDDPTRAQARTMLEAMYDARNVIADQLADIERRYAHKPLRGDSPTFRHRAEMHRDLVEAQRIIDGLLRRFPELRESAQPGQSAR